MIKTKPAAIRSNEENRYYHGQVCGLITKHHGWREGQAHAWVKITFGVESTAELTTTEFEDLMETVRQHCLKYWDLIIPLPDSSH